MTQHNTGNSIEATDERQQTTVEKWRVSEEMRRVSVRNSDWAVFGAWCKEGDRLLKLLEIEVNIMTQHTTGNSKQATIMTQHTIGNRYIKYTTLIKTTKGVYRLWDKKMYDSIDLSSAGTNYVRSILTGSQFDDVWNFAKCTLTAPQMQKLVEHYVI